MKHELIFRQLRNDLRGEIFDFLPLQTSLDDKIRERFFDILTLPLRNALVDVLEDRLEIMLHEHYK